MHTIIFCLHSEPTNPMSKAFSFLRKAGVRIPLVIVATLIILLSVVSIGVSYFVPWYLNHNGQELIGRRIYLDRSRINLFSGKISLDSLNIYEPDAQTLFFGIGRVETDIRMHRLFSGTIDLEYLNLDHLYAHAQQRDSIFNFSDLITRFSSNSPDTTSSSTPIIINKIDISRSFIHYEDLVIGSDFRLENFDVFIPGIDLTQPDASVGLHLNFVDGGTLATAIQYDDKAQTYELSFQLGKFNIASILPYVRQTLNVGRMEGFLDADIRLKGSLLHILDITASGTSRFSQVNIVGAQGDPLFSADSIDDHLNNFSFLGQEVSLDYVHIYRPAAHYNISPSGSDNISRLLSLLTEASDSTAAPTPEEALWQIRIGDLRVLDGSVQYADSSLQHQPFRYGISGMQLDAKNFDLYGTNRLRLSALLQKVGQIHADYQGRFDDLSNLSLALNVQNVPLTDFTPYTLSLFGNAITDGTLALNSRTTIRNNALQADNNLVLYKPAVDKRHKDIEPEMKKIPLRTGIYILTDRNGKCDLDLPVTGQIDEPEFSYRRAVLKVLGQLLVKVVTSPFKRGASDSDADLISFDKLLADISPEEYEQLDELALLMTDRPEISTALHLQINPELAQKELATLPEASASDSLMADARMRQMQSVQRYLTEQKGIDSNRIRITEATAEESQTYTGAHGFAITIDMADDSEADNT